MVTNVYFIRTIERCLKSLHNAAHQNVHSLDTVATILKKCLKKRNQYHLGSRTYVLATDNSKQLMFSFDSYIYMYVNSYVILK